MGYENMATLAPYEREYSEEEQKKLDTVAFIYNKLVEQVSDSLDAPENSDLFTDKDRAALPKRYQEALGELFTDPDDAPGLDELNSYELLHRMKGSSPGGNVEKFDREDLSFVDFMKNVAAEYNIELPESDDEDEEKVDNS